MRVGIVVPAFNVRPYIGACLRSVLAQTHGDWTLAVVDDGSTDGSAEMVASVAGTRARLIRQANAGVSAARNAGLAALPETDTVLFLDADDWLASDALARLTAALIAPAVAVCGTYSTVAETAAPGDKPLALRRRPCRPGNVLPALRVRNLFANGGHVLLGRDGVARAGPFRVDLRFGEDWEYWTRIAALGPVAVLPAPPVLFVRQRHGGALLGRAADPAAYTPCLNAIFANAPGRARAEAEITWTVARERIRHGRPGLRLLARAAAAAPSARRLALLAIAAARHLLPKAVRGPFRPYPPPPGEPPPSPRVPPIMSDNPLEITPEREQRIRQRAYHLWEDDGRPEGNDLEYWERARELIGMEESAGAGLIGNPQNHPGPASGEVIEEAELQENLGEFPDRSADQGDWRQTPMPVHSPRFYPENYDEPTRGDAP